MLPRGVYWRHERVLSKRRVPCQALHASVVGEEGLNTLARREWYLSMTAFTCASWPFCMSAIALRSFRPCSSQPPLQTRL